MARFTCFKSPKIWGWRNSSPREHTSAYLNLHKEAGVLLKMSTRLWVKSPARKKVENVKQQEKHFPTQAHLQAMVLVLQTILWSVTIKTFSGWSSEYRSTSGTCPAPPKNKIFALGNDFQVFVLWDRVSIINTGGQKLSVILSASQVCHTWPNFQFCILKFVS